jgi:hypothetical protein
LAGCHLSRSVTFCDILSKGGTLFYNKTLTFDLTLTKIRVYVSDNLDTIPKRSKVDITWC